MRELFHVCFIWLVKNNITFFPVIDFVCHAVNISQNWKFSTNLSNLHGILLRKLWQNVQFSPQSCFP